ncbi:MAG: Hemolysin activation/secretion protein-like protein [Verrucomicrobiales bacterium]|nr:Hemolysin activation/secretion protein-like protein [Verrucomicrobiales bacterium]
MAALLLRSISKLNLIPAVDPSKPAEHTRWLFLLGEIIGESHRNVTEGTFACHNDFAISGPMLPPHLSFVELSLEPGKEWTNTMDSWTFLQLREGNCYWLQSIRVQELGPGDMLVIPIGSDGLLRASQLAPAKMVFFRFCPDLASGFLTSWQRDSFTYAASKKRPTAFFDKKSPQAELYLQMKPLRNRGDSMGDKAKALQVVALCFSEELPETRQSEGTQTSQERFDIIIRQLPEAELVQYGPEKLAMMCKCSTRHFTRLFKRHFGKSIRDRQTELRLQKARHLLSETDAKVIHVALDSGYRHLGLFNSMFKKHQGMTPTKWRQQNRVPKNIKDRKRLKAVMVIFGLAILLSITGRAAETPPATNDVQSATNAAPAKPVFVVKGYDVQGNTILPQETIDLVLSDHTGEHVTLDEIRTAVKELTLAYRARGFVTVSVTPPPQKLTNGIVRLDVTEGKLVEVTVVNNKHFSTANVLRSLPSLQTNTFLNSLVFQQELDKANTSRDRQIYPEVTPGPEPGTSALRLKVQDRFPLHGRFEVNNVSTPGTPQLRMNASAQYNNLWQLDHQVGFQYNWTPFDFKEKTDMPFHFLDHPLAASYSAYYKMPLNLTGNNPAPVSVGEFGYDEATKKFRPPPLGQKPELTFFASRSDSDTSLQVQSETLTPASLPPAGGLQVSDKLEAQTLSQNEGVGFRLSLPLPPVEKVRSYFAAGLDLKSYRSTAIQQRTFRASLFVPESGSSGPPYTEFPSPPTTTRRNIRTEITYLPVSLNWDASRPDKYGETILSINQSINIPGVFSHKKDFVNASGATNSTDEYYIISGSLTREQKLVADINATMRLSGQWANGPLISNEQIPFGGMNGPRGYREGAEYGDTGWKVTFEPHTPLIEAGLVDGTQPMRVRGSIFMDYGERYLLEPSGRQERLEMWGAGFGLSGTIGQFFDFRFSVAWPFTATPSTRAVDPHYYFAVAAQF